MRERENERENERNREQKTESDREGQRERKINKNKSLNSSKMSIWGGRRSSHSGRIAIDSKLIMMQFNNVSKVRFFNSIIMFVASEIAFNSYTRYGVKHYSEQFNKRFHK